MAKIKLRRDTYQNWYTANPVLADGEPAFDSTNKKLKLGDGVKPWRELGYMLAGDMADANIWVKEFQETDGPPYTSALVTSVEYTAGGDIIALLSINHDGDDSYIGVIRLDTTGTKIWSIRLVNDQYTDGWGLAVDNQGEYIYVAGRQSGDSPYSIATLTKLRQSDGTVVWSKAYDVGYDNTNNVVDVASDGNPVAVGYAYNGEDNMVVTTKINKVNGDIVWSRSLNGQGDEEAYGMGVGPSGEIVTVGYMDIFGISNAAATLVADNPPSSVDWIAGTYPFEFDGLSGDIVVDNVGEVTVENVVDTKGGREVEQSVFTIPAATIGGSSDLHIFVASLIPNDNTDRMLIVKYSSTGSILWQKAVQFDEDYYCTGADADIDSDGNIYVCGQYEIPDNENNAISIVKFNSSGVKQWSRRVVGTCEDFGTSIVVGPDDFLYLSGVTGNNNATDYSLVVAKYSKAGEVTWQRILDNSTDWTFAGGWWFGSGGGSNLAVKEGYVSIGGLFGGLNGPGVAIVSQVDNSGIVWSSGNYEYKSASFTGLLNTGATDITVVNAGKTDADYSDAYSVSAVNLDFDSSNYLLETLHNLIEGNTGLITWDGIKMIGAGTAGENNKSTIEIVPDNTLYSITSGNGYGEGGQYLVIEPTGGALGHVHIRAGGPIDEAASQLILGGEKANITIRDQDDSFNEKHYVIINAETNDGNHFSWTFDDSGTVTFPGRLVESTISKTGQIGVGTGRVATVTLNPTNNANFVPGSYDGISVGLGTGFTVTLNVASNGDLSCIVTESGTGFEVGNTATIYGSVISGGTTSTDDVTVTVQTLSHVLSATQLDIHKSIQKLTDGTYALANGIEGQIMYLVQQTGGTNAARVYVSKCRISGTEYTNNYIDPFDSNDNVVQLIFTDGAWQSMNGVWD